MESTIRPLGGIAALTLGVASLSGVAPTLSEDDNGVQIPLLEDRSTYSETVTYIGHCPSVKHSLQIITPLEYTLPEELQEGLDRGFVALVSLNSKGEISVGWSEEAASDRALRLVSCSTLSGEKPASRGYKEWLFESTDGVQNI
ncbi:MAG: hypothetical protein SNG38_00265 [Rikenellaceae bacterium]